VEKKAKFSYWEVKRSNFPQSSHYGNFYTSKSKNFLILFPSFLQHCRPCLFSRFIRKICDAEEKFLIILFSVWLLVIDLWLSWHANFSAFTMFPGSFYEGSILLTFLLVWFPRRTVFQNCFAENWMGIETCVFV
jgi:hypothetical protein